MGVLLAGLAAAFAGTGDFLGGFASRRANTWAVGTWNHVAGAVTVLAIAPFLDGSLSGELILWGSLAGVGGAMGVMGLYTGFARSDIAVVSRLPQWEPPPGRWSGACSSVAFRPDSSWPGSSSGSWPSGWSAGAVAGSWPETATGFDSA
ncbi:MAG: hypothetical protein OEO77_01040 [Acidimicrobiia bacterium]|nr:hypothetical protein [Acidimicrobiia bacterium]